MSGHDLSSRFHSIHEETFPRMKCPSQACLTMEGESVTICNTFASVLQTDTAMGSFVTTSYGTTHSSCPRKSHIKSHICVLKNHIQLQNQQMCQLTCNKRSLLSAPQQETLGEPGLAPSQESCGISCPHWGFPLSW